MLDFYLGHYAVFHSLSVLWTFSSCLIVSLSQVSVFHQSSRKLTIALDNDAYTCATYIWEHIWLFCGTPVHIIMKFLFVCQFFCSEFYPTFILFFHYMTHIWLQYLYTILINTYHHCHCLKYNWKYSNGYTVGWGMSFIDKWCWNYVTWRAVLLKIYTVLSILTTRIIIRKLIDA